MQTIEFIVRIDVDGDAETMARCFEQYVTHPEFPFLTDFGVGADGGYEGPFALAVAVEPHSAPRSTTSSKPFEADLMLGTIARRSS